MYVVCCIANKRIYVATCPIALENNHISVAAMKVQLQLTHAFLHFKLQISSTKLHHVHA